MDHHDVDAAVTETLRILGPHTAEDWTVAAGPLEWSCWETAAHIAHDLLAYAAQLAARPATAYLPIDLAVRPSASPADVLQAVKACGGLLSSALADAGPALRAWHWGPTDPEGFAAMGVAEILLHTHDIAQGLGLAWLPPRAQCAAVLARLASNAPPGDPVQVLLWYTGRAELDGQAHQTRWVWRAARAE